MSELSTERKGRVTASRIGAICGASKYRTAEDAMRDMVREYHGLPREFVGNIATEWGKSHEREAFESAVFLIEGLEEDQQFYIAHDIFGATPDVKTPDATGDIKCPFGWRDRAPDAQEYLDKNPEYYLQLQWQMLCTKKEKAHFIVWTPVGTDAICVEVDGNKIDEMTRKARDFYLRYQEIITSHELSAPYLQDKEDYLERDDVEFSALAEAYKLAKSEADSAAERLENVRNELLAITTQNTKGCGVTIYCAEKKGAVDYKKVPELKGVDLEPYRKQSTKVWTVKS